MIFPSPLMDHCATFQILDEKEWGGVTGVKGFIVWCWLWQGLPVHCLQFLNSKARQLNACHLRQDFLTITINP